MEPMKTLSKFFNFVWSASLLLCLLIISLYDLTNSQVFALAYLAIFSALFLYINHSINKLK